MKRVLVTGAGGFIGRHVTPLLAASGWDVHGVTSRDRPPHSALTWHRANLLDAGDRARLITAVEPSALLHLAWSSEPPGYWTDPANLNWLAATLELARLFKNHGGERLVGAGTCAEYDWRAGICVERQTPLAPRTLYGATKAASGTVLEAYGVQTGLSVAWARLFFLFGPHDSPARLVPSLVRRLAFGQPARCQTGRHARDFMHVADAAAALVATLESKLEGPVNLGSGTALHVEVVARHIAATLDTPGLLTVEDGPPDDALVMADVTRLRNEVEWRPAADTMTRLDETIAWWRATPAAAPENNTASA
jgi:nucleoside-diphosphate-sugar epimerase